MSKMDLQPDRIFLENYTYDLPLARIAPHPLPERDSSRLLTFQQGVIRDARFRDLPDELPPGALLVFNDTRVIEARIFFHKPTGGRIELFCLEPHEQAVELSLQEKGGSRWRCLIGGASKWKPGQVLEKTLQVEGKEVLLTARYEGRAGDAFVIHFSWEPADLSFGSVLQAAGSIPLPPYIKRAAEAGDAERYQTVFNRQPGSVAAPTASLHFTTKVLEELQARGIDTAYLTLHVGAGTFRPVKTPTIAGHDMHFEPFTVSRGLLQQLLAAGTIIPVGTTSLRTLESLFWLGVKLLSGVSMNDWTLQQWEAYELSDRAVDPKASLGALLEEMERNNWEELHCRTGLLIVPGYRFRLPAALVTNFHQPGSTLLLLVAAFAGPDWKRIYDHALAHGYRFLSYGDSSLLWRQTADGGPQSSAER